MPICETPGGTFSSQPLLRGAILGKWRDSQAWESGGWEEEKGAMCPREKATMAVSLPRRTGIFADKIRWKSKGHYKFINTRIILLVSTGVVAGKTL